jgi:hypothetical protein
MARILAETSRLSALYLLVCSPLAAQSVNSPGVSFAPPNVFLVRATPGPLNIQQAK